MAFTACFDRQSPSLERHDNNKSNQNNNSTNIHDCSHQFTIRFPINKKKSINSYFDVCASPRCVPILRRRECIIQLPCLETSFLWPSARTPFGCWKDVEPLSALSMPADPVMVKTLLISPGRPPGVNWSIVLHGAPRYLISPISIIGALFCVITIFINPNKCQVVLKRLSMRGWRLNNADENANIAVPMVVANYIAQHKR